MDEKNTRYCDSCQFLDFEADSDPEDSFSINDEKAICKKMNALIAGSLEPREQSKIVKPIWCPYLGRELTDLEKKFFESRLSIAEELR